MTLKNTAKALTLFGVLIAGAGCGSGEPAAQQPVPLLGPISTVTRVDQLDRPIDRFEVTYPQVAKLLAATDAATAWCMKGFGLAAPPSDPDALSDSVRQLRMRSEIYGFYDPADVSAKGYDAVVGVDPGSGDAGLPEIAQSVLNGRDKSGQPVLAHNGKAVPPGGCRKLAQDAVGGRPPFPGSASDLPDSGPRIPLTDPRLVDVNSRWSSCMKTKGFVYATPADAYIDPKWRPRSPSAQPTHSPDEIATAVADMDCKQATNLMGVVLAVETAYDRQYIASHTAQLTQYRNQIDAQVARADRIIAAGGAVT
ncbi:hypothetical protein [Kutzneria kofuensis]|uniref:Uncharacterized protein n=1 Tax=Kutzneria kofuensis TaxID=103725 RepID=A0A7W9KBV6_9PSEU|nr:hypothetical protein [Kutzneria kofuensis]MBB5888949.1 hypothetical protein [Kutzneria kofuensis]